MRKLKIKLINGESLKTMKKFPDNVVDSVVTDPPYSLHLGEQYWLNDIPSVEIWKEILRILKPGGHILSFSGTRVQHRATTNIENAGFDIRDSLAWVYGKGFPKNHDISKAFDRKAGAKRKVIGQKKHRAGMSTGRRFGISRPYGEGEKNVAIKIDITAPTTPEAKLWDGWGTALKPTMEPIALARKPLSEKTIIANILKWGTGGINIDGCRFYEAKKFPTNFLHDGSEEIEGILGKKSRFFYCNKTSPHDRGGDMNKHPTVKPTQLMSYLCRLITPPGGIVLDPFMGSGSTGKACIREGFHFLGIEYSKEYYKIAQERIKMAQEELKLNGLD